MGKKRILVKLIDEAILPAFLILSAKIISLFAIIELLNISFSLNTQTIFPLLSFESRQDLVLVNSYSNLFMFLVIVLGLLWVLSRAHLTHDTHIHPSLTLKLFTFNLDRLITTSFEIYHQAWVWLVYLWISTLSLGLQAWGGTSYRALVFLAFLAGLVLSSLLVIDIEREFQS